MRLLRDPADIIKGQFSQSGEITYETTFTSTILLQLGLTAAILVLFSLLRYLLPGIYNPRYSKGVRFELLWFIDIFRQPFSAFVKCGNMAAVFVMYQTMLIGLFIVLSVFGLTILIPIYFYGTDQSFSIAYRTFWSKLSLAHVEAGSMMVLVPTLVTVLFAVILLQFYTQFNIMYVYYRQRTLRRAAPHNFVVMLEGLPSQLRTVEDIARSLDHSFPRGAIRRIVPVPRGSTGLILRYKRLLRLIREERRLNDEIALLRGKHYMLAGHAGRRGGAAAPGRTGLLASLRALTLSGLTGKIDATLRRLLRLHDRIRSEKMEILSHAYRENFDLGHLAGIEHLPPRYPACVTSFNNLTTAPRVAVADIARAARGEPPARPRRVLEAAAPASAPAPASTPAPTPTPTPMPVALPAAALLPVAGRYARHIPPALAARLARDAGRHGLPPSERRYLDSRNSGFAASRSLRDRARLKHVDQPVGGAAFLVFRSHEAASQASASLIYMDDREPTVRPAPDPNNIIWGNLSSQSSRDWLFMGAFVLVVVAVIIVYFIPQTLLLNVFRRNEIAWFNILYSHMCLGRAPARPRCKEHVSITGETRKDLGSTACYLCYKASSTLITLSPTVVQSVFISMIPVVMKVLSLIPRFTSVTQRLNVQYLTTFIFLVLIIGIIQIIVTSTFDAQGVIDLRALAGLSIKGFIVNIGEHFPAQVFTFLNYIITKYFMFTMLSLLRLPQLFATAVKYLLTRDPLLRKRIHVYPAFPYVKQLAYSTHMMIIGLMYAVVSPISTIIVCLIYVSFSIVDRFNILYVYSPQAESEMSAETDMVKHLAGNTYLGFIIMMIATMAFLVVLGRLVTYFCAAVLLAVLLVSIIGKLYIDRKYKRAVYTLQLSDWVPDGLLTLNPYNEATARDYERRPVATRAGDRLQRRGAAAARHVYECFQRGGGAVDAMLRETESADTELNSSETEQAGVGAAATATAAAAAAAAAVAGSASFGGNAKDSEGSGGGGDGGGIANSALMRADINMRSLQENPFERPPVNFEHPPVSYMMRTSVLYPDYACRLANPGSVGPYELTDEDVSNVAAYYTHPAYLFSYVYSPLAMNDEVL